MSNLQFHSHANKLNQQTSGQVGQSLEDQAHILDLLDDRKSCLAKCDQRFSQTNKHEERDWWVAVSQNHKLEVWKHTCLTID